MRTPNKPTETLLRANGIGLHYRIDGRADRPWLTFCNSLGTDLSMWDRQIEALGEHFHILRYDRRGHGLSRTPPAPYRMQDLGEDVLALWDRLGIQRSHYCGLSIGGLTGQWLALNAPQRLDRVVLCSTAARIGTEDGWNARIAQVREHGMESITEGTVSRWFNDSFVAARPGLVQHTLENLRQVRVEGYAGCCAALIGADFREQLGAITHPVLALAGAQDPVTTPDDLRQLAEGVAAGRYAEIAGRHICNMESPAAFNEIVRDFLLD